VIVLAAVALLAVLAGAAAIGAAATLGDRQQRQGAGLGAVMAIPVAVGAVIVVLLVVIVGVGGARSSRGDDEGTTGVAAPDTHVATRVEGSGAGLSGPPARLDGRVTIDGSASPLHAFPVVAVHAGDVLDVRGHGFTGATTGVIAQCLRADARRCRNLVTVTTGQDGTLRSPYRVEGAASGAVLVVEVDLDRAAARLDFRADGVARAGATLHAAGGRVTIRGVPPGEPVTLLGCPRGITSVDGCATIARPVAAADGTASVDLEDAYITSGTQLALVDAARAVVAGPLDLAARPRPRPDVTLAPGRVVSGLALAVLLIGVAVRLIRSTDWRAPTEAATPYLDAAALDAAPLDA
jgi:hypothetical protein